MAPDSVMGKKFHPILEMTEKMVCEVYEKETGGQMRAFEMAAIIRNLLNDCGYTHMLTMYGVYVTDDGQKIAHFWINGKVTFSDTWHIIETTPYDRRVCPNSEGKELAEVMDITCLDYERKEHYHRLELEEYKAILEKDSISIDQDLIFRYSYQMGILAKIKESGVLKY